MALKRLQANEDAERRAKLEEYFLMLMRKTDRANVYLDDLTAAAKRLGVHGSRVIIAIGAAKLSGWIENLFK